MRQLLAAQAAGAGNGLAPRASSPPRGASARIGKYEIEAETGHSALVKVFRAFDRDTGRPVTLKVLTDVADPLLIERFRREVAIAAKLRNDHMIAVYELGEYVGLPFAAIEYPGQDDLRRAIKSRRNLTFLEKLLIMWQVAEGLQAAHRGGLTYVGVRPSGIALSSNGAATVQDFGIVRLSAEAQDDSLLYAAPEELAGDLVPDELCDIFSYGAVFYELLTGVHPFSGGASNPMAISLVRTEPAPLRELAPDCPAELERLVCRALDRHRELRYQSFDDVQYDAEPILRGLKRQRAGDLLADARHLMDARKLQDAQAVVRELLELDPENRKAQRLRTVLHELLQREMIGPRVEALLHEANQEAAARRFARAAEILKSALRLDASNLKAKESLEEVLIRLERSQISAALLTEAHRLADQLSLAEARAKASEALDADPESMEALELIESIGEAIAKRERDAKLEQGLANAKSLLLLQSFDAAISLLSELRAECPGSPLVDQWLAHVQAQKTEAERQARLQAQINEARSLLTEERFAEAVFILEALSGEFPGETRLSDLLAQARAAMERASRVRGTIARAEEFCREGQFAEALGFIDAALTDLPSDPVLGAFRRDLEQHWEAHKSSVAVRQVLEEAEWLLNQDRPDLAAQFLRERAADFPNDPNVISRLAAIENLLPQWEQQRLIHDSLRQVEALEQAQQWAVALTVLEEALEGCPASEELLEAAERVRSRLLEQERRKKLTRRMEVIAQRLNAQAWPQALSLIEAAQLEFPAEPELQLLLNEAQAGLRCSERERIAAEVRQCLVDGEIEQAEEVLREGLEALPGEPALHELLEELQADKVFREEWRTAQVHFGRRQFEEAERILVKLVSSHRPEVQALLERVRESRAASEEDRFYKKGREKALKLIQEQQFEQAADLLRNLLSLFPNDPILERDLHSTHGAAAPGPASDAPEPVAPVVKNSLDAPETVNTAPADLVIGVPEPPAPKADPAAQLIALSKRGPRSLAPAPRRVPVVAAAGMLAIVSGGLTFWRFSKSEAPAPKPAPQQVAREAAPRRVVLPPPPPQPAEAQPAASQPEPVIPPPTQPSTQKEAAQSKPAGPSLRPFSLPPSAKTEVGRGPSSLPAPPPSTVLLVSDTPGLPVSTPPVTIPAPPPANPQTPPQTKAQEPPRVGGNFRQPELISKSSPIMPNAAKIRGLYGTVQLEATVNKQGTVTGVKVQSGNALLASAAKDAVLKWRYRPATLNGEPIEIQVIVQVVFQEGHK